MSMSAEEILVNCEKQFAFIEKDIETLISYIKDLLQQCKELDNSNFYEEQISSLLKKVKLENEEITRNTYQREIAKDTHVAIETYHEIQRFMENKRESIADFKSQIFSFKKDILIKEQEQIKKSLSNNNFGNVFELKNQLIKEYKNDEDKLFIKKLFEEKESLLINKTKEQILEIIFIEIQKAKTSQEALVKEIISNSTNLYKDDREILDAMKKDVEIFSNTSHNEDFSISVKKYFLNSSKSAEQEVIRKDNVSKIIKAIEEVGYKVDLENIRKIEVKNLIIIHGEKPTGETADFAVRLDGSFVYNWEGFEGKEHDVDAQAFLNKLKQFNIYASEEFKKQYREPKYIAKNRSQIKKKQSDSNR